MDIFSYVKKARNLDTELILVIKINSKWIIVKNNLLTLNTFLTRCVGFPHKINLQHQLGALQFNSVLTVGRVITDSKD